MDSSLEDLSNLLEKTKIPLSRDLVKTNLDLACVYLSKDPPSEGDYSDTALRLGKDASYSFVLLKCVTPYTPNVPLDMNGFMDVWPQAFRWSQYLLSAIRYIYSHHSEADADSESVASIRFAMGVYTFLHVTAKWPSLRTDHSQDKRLFEFAVSFWAMKGVPRCISDCTTNALIQFMTDLDGDTLILMDAMQSHFESAGEIARLVIDRARLVLSEMDFSAMVAHYGLLALTTRPEMVHPLSETIIAEGASPFAVTSLSSILDARGWTLEDWRFPSVLCLQTIMAGCRYPDSGKFVIEAINCGLLEVLFTVGQINGLDNRMLTNIILGEKIPLLMHRKSVFGALRRGHSKFSRKIDHRLFDFGRLQAEFRDTWRTFEILSMEHTVLRHMYARGIQNVFVYCGNVSRHVILAVPAILTDTA